MFFCEGIGSQEGTRDDAGRNRQPPRRKALGRDRTCDLLIVRQGCEPAATPAASRLYRENLLCLRKVCCVPKCCTSLENSRSPPHLGDQAVAPGLFHIYQNLMPSSAGPIVGMKNNAEWRGLFFFFFDQPIPARSRGCGPSSPAVVNSADPVRGPVTQTNMSAPVPQHDPGAWLPDRDQRSRQSQKMC